MRNTLPQTLPPDPAQPPTPHLNPAPLLNPADELYRLWQVGPPPDLDAFLIAAGPLSSVDLAAVMHVDQRCRWEIGQPVPAERYLKRYPQLLEVQESALDFIYGELLLREQHGENPSIEEFVARFPAFDAFLRKQIRVHRALCADPPTADRRHDDKPAPPLPGHNRYEIVREIGRGGMGIVYEARQAGVNRIVALKLLSAGMHAGPDQLSRFRAEAELVGRLQHPHIVQIYEAGQQDGFPFLALEFVGGGSLRNRLKGAPQSPEGSARLVETLARAVHVAHQAGVVHRDLKPGNILFASGSVGGSPNRAPDHSWSADEVPKIADFGLAKGFLGPAGDEPSASLTRTGDILGTPNYMSPEQAAGRTDQIGPATDIYALGAILYELLTGRPPFQGVTVLETLQHLAAEEPVPPARLQPHLPRDLEVICLKCLQKQPGLRYTTALDLAEDLRRFLSAVPILARPISRLARLRRWCRRNPVPAALTSLVALLASNLVIGSVTATINLRRAASDRLVDARVAEARAVRLGDRMGRRERSRALLADAARLHPGPEVRDEAIAAMAVFDLPVVGRGPHVSEDCRWIDFDGRLVRYVRGDRNGRTTIHRVADEVEICQIPELLPNAVLLLSPDGNYLAARSGASVAIWQVAEGRPELVHREPCQADYGMGAVDFASDSRRIAIGRPDGTVGVHSLPPGTFHREWKFDSSPRHLAFHSDGKEIAIAGRNGVEIRDCESGRLRVRLEEAAGAVQVAWQPQGTLLATADADLGISLWDTKTFRRRLTLRGHDNTGMQFQFDTSGTMLVSRAWDGVARFWDTCDGTLLYASMDPMSIGRCASDRDRWVGSALAGPIQFCQADAREVYTRLSFESSPAGSERCHGLAIGHKGIAGSRLLAVATDRGIRFWDIATRRSIGFLPVGSVDRVQFDGSGTMWSNGRAGIARWPIQESTDEPGTLVVGPASILSSAPTDGDLAATPDGRTLVCGGTASAFILHPDVPDFRLDLQGHGDPRYAAVSPDGRWIATGSHTESKVKIWDARTGTLVRDLEMAGSRVEFSPDGAWLATTGGGLALWSVRDWTRVWQGSGHFLSGHAFTADGRFVAGDTGAGDVVLFESASGREVARLADPHGYRLIYLTLSPDGRYLAGISYNFRNLCLWDLQEVDTRLKALGVPWEWPSIRASQTGESEIVPLKIETRTESRQAALERQLADVTRQVDDSPQDEGLHFRRGWLLHELDRPHEAIDELTKASDVSANPGTLRLRAHAHAAANDYAHAIADAAAALGALAPQDPRRGTCCNQLAWYYATAPVELRRPPEAVGLARQALRREPGRAAYFNTLGVAQCRSGEWDDAIESLCSSLRAGSDAPASDWYFLALCHHRLQHERQATEAFEQAVFWHETHEPDLDGQTRRELAAARHEVESVLGVAPVHQDETEPLPESDLPPAAEPQLRERP